MCFVLYIGKKVSEFNGYLGNDGSSESKIGELKQEVIEFAKKFPTIGYSENEMKYK